MYREVRQANSVVAKGRLGEPPPATQLISVAQSRRLAIHRPRRDNLTRTIKHYRSRLQLNPADIHSYKLGATLLDHKHYHYQFADSCYHHASELRSVVTSTPDNLKGTLGHLRWRDEPIALRRKPLKSKLDNVWARMNYACALREDGDLEEFLGQHNNAHLPAPNNAGAEGEVL